jgi:hypothetical protein
MTYVIIALALGAAVATWLAARGHMDLSLDDPVAKQAVTRARTRRRVTWEALAVFAGAHRTPPAPLFPTTSVQDADGAAPPIPDWHPTAPREN